MLGGDPVPSDEDISAQGPFDPQSISPAEFDSVWAAAFRSAAEPAKLRSSRKIFNRLVALRYSQEKPRKIRLAPMKKSHVTELDIVPAFGKWVVLSPVWGVKGKTLAEARTRREATTLAKKILRQHGGTLTIRDKAGVVLLRLDVATPPDRGASVGKIKKRRASA